MEESIIMKKIAVLGYGVVGSGVVELFYRNQKKIEKNTGTELEVGYILDLREFPDDPYGCLLYTSDAADE